MSNLLTFGICRICIRTTPTESLGADRVCAVCTSEAYVRRQSAVRSEAETVRILDPKLAAQIAAAKESR